MKRFIHVWLIPAVFYGILGLVTLAILAGTLLMAAAPLVLAGWLLGVGQ